MQPYTLIELVLYNILRAVPLINLAFYPFHNRQRYSAGVTTALVGLILAVWMGESLFSAYFAGSALMKFGMELVGIMLIAVLYVTAVRAHPGKILFICFMLINVGYLITATAKCLEGYLFPAMAMDKYRWSASVCILVISPFIQVPVIRFLKWEKENLSKKMQPVYIWQFSWLVPTAFYLVWAHDFYGVESSLRWCMDIGNVIFLLVVNMASFMVYYLMLRLIKDSSDYLSLREENHAMAMEIMQYDGLNQRIALARQGRHDLRHHILSLEKLAEEGDMEAVRRYLDELGEKYQLEGALIYCSNTTVNAILSFFSEQAKKAAIEYRVNIGIPEDINITKTDLSILFGNLMENAVEACMRQQSGDRKINVRGQTAQNTFAFTIDNTYESIPAKDRRGRFRSLKHSGAGIGTESVKNIVANYNGVIEFETKGDLFCVSVMMYLS